MNDDGIFGKFVEMRNTFHEDVARGGDSGEAAFSYRLEDGEEWLYIVADGLDVRDAFSADETRCFIRGVLYEMLGEFGIGRK